MGSEVLTTVIWALSLFVPAPGRYGLWGAAFTVNIAGVFILYTFFDTVLVQDSHFPERLGLITIIVLGETILAVAFGSSIVTSGAGFVVPPLVTGAAGFLIAIGAWWLYFVNFDEDVIDRALNAPGEHAL